MSSDVGLPVLLLSAPSASPSDLTTSGSFDWPKSVDCKQTINEGRHSQANMQEIKKNIATEIMVNDVVDNAIMGAILE